MGLLKIPQAHPLCHPTQLKFEKTAVDLACLALLSLESVHCRLNVTPDFSPLVLWLEPQASSIHFFSEILK